MKSPTRIYQPFLLLIVPRALYLIIGIQMYCSILEHFMVTQQLRSVCDQIVQLENIIGRRVAEARSTFQPPLTQDALSGHLARVGIQLDRAAIAKIETNRRSVLDYEFKAIAEVLGVGVDWLLGSVK